MTELNYLLFVKWSYKNMSDFKNLIKGFGVNDGDEYFGDDFEKILPSKDEKDWLGLKQDDFRPDRQKFVLDKFFLKYPKFKDKVANFDEFSKLLNRNVTLKQDYEIWDSEYVNDVKVPEYYKNMIDIEKYNEIQNKISSLRKIQQKRAEELRRLSENYKKALEEVNNKKEYLEMEKEYGKDPYLYVLTLQGDQLPISVALKIEKYAPLKTGAPTRDAYAREALINYKIGLIKQIKENDLSGDEVIRLVEENGSK